jgi:hypothetical protein
VLPKFPRVFPSSFSMTVGHSKQLFYGLEPFYDRGPFLSSVLIAVNLSMTEGLSKLLFYDRGPFQAAFPLPGAFL